MTELATGYISLVVETSKIPGQVNKAMKGVEGQADKAGKGMGGRLADGMGGVLKKSAAGVGIAAGAAVAAGMTKGIGRLSAIEQAEAKLTGLGNSAGQVEGIMTNALSSVKGTAHGLEEAATVAAGMVAAGVKPGQELEGVLKTVGDTAAIAGVSMQEMGSIFGKVAATGKLQGDELMQLSDAGIPALSLLSKHLGKTTEEVRKMVSDGKVSFADFSAAMEAGMGGAALKMGDTTVGAFKNMGAAAGRLGATLAGPFFDQAGGAFRGVTDLLDALNDKAGPVMADLDAWLSGTLVPGLADLGSRAVEAWQAFARSDMATTSLVRLRGIFSQLVDLGKGLAPAVGGIVESLGRASAAIGISTWDALLSVLEASAAVLDATLVPALQFTADLMQDNQAAVTTLVAAYMAFKTVPGIMGKVGEAFSPVVSKGNAAKVSLSDFSGAVRDSYTWMRQANPEMGKVGASAAILGANAKAAAKGGLSAMKTAGSNLLGLFGGPLGAAFTGVTVAVTAGIAAHQRMESAQRALEDASHDLAAAQVDMWSQISDASGVADAVVAQVDAVRDAMEAAIAGEQRGFGARMSQMGKGMWEGAQIWRTDQWGDGGFFNNDEVNAANAIADAAGLAKAALDELGMSNDDVAEKIRGSDGDWEAFTARLRASGDGGAEAVAKLQPLRDEYVQLQEAQRLASPGALELSAAVDVLADSASSADDKLDAMRSALEALGLIQTSAEQQAFELAEQVEKVAESAIKTSVAADEMGNAFFTADGTLNPLNKNTRDLNTQLFSLGEEFRSMAQKTGDAHEAWGMISPQLESIRGQLGLTQEEFQVLLNEYGLAPELIQTMVKLEGADEARQKISEVAMLMDRIPDGEPKTVTMRVEDQAARDALTNLGLKVTEIEGKPGMVRIHADGTLAVAAMNAIAGQLAGLDASVATPDINADATIFRIEDQAVRASLQQLDMTKVDPQVGAIIDDFINGRDVTLAELSRIDATVADPHIKATIDEALQKAKIVNDALNNAARERTAYITLVERGATQYSSGGTAVGHHYGPRRATGGRLPTTGPGTSTTDGILAVAESGMPIARVNAGEWVINDESSDDYNHVLGLINRDDPSVRHLKGYADGGRVSADEVLDFLHARTPHGQSRSLQGAPYDWAGINWGDCSATQAAAWRFATGLDPFGGRFATASQLEAIRGMGGVPGPGGPDDLTTAWYNGGPGGGHTTGSVGGVHFEMGGGAGGQGKIGGAAASPFTGPWQHIYHLPLADPFDWSDKPYTGRRGSGLTVGDYAAEAFTGRTNFGARGGSGAGQQRPTTWSELAGDAAAALVGGLTEDALGVFGIPNQLPPALQAWQMLNEGEGPTDWDLSVLAAKAKQLDAQVKVRQRFVDEAQAAIDQINTSPVGNALPAQMIAAQDQLDAEKRELERTRTEWEQARTRLEDALGARAAALEGGNEGASERELAEVASKTADELAETIDITPVYDPSKRAEQWAPVIDKVLKEKGLPLSYRDAVIHRMNQESGGDPRAQNDWDSNAAAGNPSKGAMQTTQTTFDAYKDPGHGDIWNLEDNLRASLNYVMRDPKYAGRTVEDVYRQAGAYFRGGEVTLPPGMQPGVDTVPAWLTPGERVVRNGPSQRYAAEIDAMNAGRYEPRGGDVHLHYQVMTIDEAERRGRVEQRRQAVEMLGVR